MVTLSVASIDAVCPEETPKLCLPAAIGNFKTINSLSFKVVLVLIKKVVINDVNLL